ncbi:hypothetical protein [Acinetobacter sp. P8-3-8]|nr:hypothetical protein [Acinetobacter sp. P8-3-8]
MFAVFLLPLISHNVYYVKSDTKGCSLHNAVVATDRQREFRNDNSRWRLS